MRTKMGGYMAMTAMLFAEALMHSSPQSSEFEKKVEEVNYGSLIKSYKLIQQKKSRLSANQRKAVVFKVERLIKQGHISPKEIKQI